MGNWHFRWDRPAETGCYGFAFRLGRLTLSITFLAGSRS